MTAAEGASEWNTAGLAQPPVPLLRWRKVFRGDERELAVLRRWLELLLPPCPARDNVIMVANELSSNAIRHTASGRGGWFVVEVTWHDHVVRVCVTDGGGPTQPTVINDSAGESGRGLLVVQALSEHVGVRGDQRGRLVWAQVAWTDPNPRLPAPSHDPYQAAVREGEAALARQFAGVPAWFGRSTLAWWAVAGPAGLVSAPTAQELARLLDQLLHTDPAQSPATGQAHDNDTDERPATQPHRQPDAGDQSAAQWRRPDTASTGPDASSYKRPARARRPVAVPGLVAAGVV